MPNQLPVAQLSDAVINEYLQELARESVNRAVRAVVPRVLEHLRVSFPICDDIAGGIARELEWARCERPDDNIYAMLACEVWVECLTELEDRMPLCNAVKEYFDQPYSIDVSLWTDVILVMDSGYDRDQFHDYDNGSNREAACWAVAVLEEISTGGAVGAVSKEIDRDIPDKDTEAGDASSLRTRAYSYGNEATNRFVTECANKVRALPGTTKLGVRTLCGEWIDKFGWFAFLCFGERIGNSDPDEVCVSRLEAVICLTSEVIYTLEQDKERFFHEEDNYDPFKELE